MSDPEYFPEDFKAQLRFVFEKAHAERERYFNWLKDEINLAVKSINKHDKIFVLGGLGVRLHQASANFHNQFLSLHPEFEDAEEDKLIKDDEIEVLLEYAMSLATASPNQNQKVLPTAKDIELFRNQLSKIKHNISFYEMSAETPADDVDKTHWLKTRVMEDTLHVRGVGYQSHVEEIYSETFAPHNGFLLQYYGFDSTDLLTIIKRFDLLVGSKLGNLFGSSLSYQRFKEWSDERGMETIIEEMGKTGKHFIEQFTDANPDLFDENYRDGVSVISIDNIAAYNRLFWIIPQTEREKLVFARLSHGFGDNAAFIQGKYGGFPLGDSMIQTKPLIQVGEKYYCFSTNLAFRNLFNITADLLLQSDSIYYEQKFKGNSSSISRDNYIEAKVKSLFEKLLPTVRFYHSLEYDIVEDGLNKKPELDILGVGNDTLYTIEVKAGELNKKHRRGAILGLKERIKETIAEGSYQCFRAEKYISESSSPQFSYVENKRREILSLDKTKCFEIIKVSVTYEHFSTVAVNLKYLIEAGILSADYKWTWIVSLFDLMIFADLIENEQDFKEYLSHRLALYERKDVQFTDEIDVLGFFFENKFPLPSEKHKEKIIMINYKDEIDTYYNHKDLGMPDVIKPGRKK